MEHSVKLNLFPRSWWSECEIMAVNCYQAGRPGFYASQPSVSSTLLLNGWVSSWVVVRRCLLEFFLTCVSFDPWWSLSVHLIKPTSNPRLRGFVLVSHCPWIEEVAMFFGVPGRLAGLGEAGRPGFVPMSSIFGTYSPEIKTHPKFVEVIRNK